MIYKFPIKLASKELCSNVIEKFPKYLAKNWFFVNIKPTSTSLVLMFLKASKIRAYIIEVTISLH